MEDISKISEILVQLSRLAILGEQKDIRQYLQRCQRRLSPSFSKLALEINNLLSEAPSKDFPFRNVNMAAVPVDRDSRLQLFKIDNPPIELEIEPIWDSAVSSKLQQVVFEYHNPAELHKAGLSAAKTLIFSGLPGVGKTMAATWLANQLNLPLLTLDLSAVMSSFLGRTGNNVRNVFDYAKGMKCVLLLDEFDAIAKKRDDNTEIGELKRLVTVLLQELDNWPEGNILIAATNHSNLLDPAVWRRFDIFIEFPMPSEKVIPDVLKKYLGPVYKETIDIHHLLAFALQGKSFSEMRRDLMMLRRNAVITRRDIKAVANEWFCTFIDELPYKEKVEFAVKLKKAYNYSQRKISDITKISRDTLRKKMNIEEVIK